MLFMCVSDSDMHTCLYAFCVALSKYGSCLEGVVWMMQSLPSISKFVPFSGLCVDLAHCDYIISSVDWVFKNCNVKSHILIMSFFSCSSAGSPIIPAIRTECVIHCQCPGFGESGYLTPLYISLMHIKITWAFSAHCRIMFTYSKSLNLL